MAKTLKGNKAGIQQAEKIVSSWLTAHKLDPQNGCIEYVFDGRHGSPVFGLSQINWEPYVGTATIHKGGDDCQLQRIVAISVRLDLQSLRRVCTVRGPADLVRRHRLSRPARRDDGRLGGFVHPRGERRGMAQGGDALPAAYRGRA